MGPFMSAILEWGHMRPLRSVDPVHAIVIECGGDRARMPTQIAIPPRVGKHY
jgi:hypothetical protein